jgi:hypothetical protein
MRANERKTARAGRLDMVVVRLILSILEEGSRIKTIRRGEMFLSVTLRSQQALSHL